MTSYLAPVRWRRRTDEASIRTALLDAALQCYQHRGIAGTTMANIAAQAGVTRPTIYRRFNSHTALLQAVVRRELERFWLAIHSAFENSPASLGDYLADVLACSLLEARAQHSPPLLFLPGVRPIVRDILVSDRRHLYAFAHWLRANHERRDGPSSRKRRNWLLLCEGFNRLLASYLDQPSLVCRSEVELGNQLRNLLNWQHANP